MRRRSVRINKECLTKGHDWDWFGGPPDWECCRPGCRVRLHMYWGAGLDLIDGSVPISGPA